MQPAGSFGDEDIAAWLTAQGLLLQFVTALEIGDRRAMTGLLNRVIEDDQTVATLCDLYATNAKARETMIRRVRSSAR